MLGCPEGHMLLSISKGLGQKQGQVHCKALYTSCLGAQEQRHAYWYVRCPFDHAPPLTPKQRTHQGRA